MASTTVQMGSASYAFAMYGMGVGGDTLANTIVGIDAARTCSLDRFKAEASGALDSVTIYYLGPPDPGYALGTGGTWKVELFAVDGSGLPTGSALATQAVAAHTASQANTEFGNEAQFKVTFSSPYSVVAGTRYCLVYTNTDADKAANYFSIDRWCQFDGVGYSADRDVPRWLTADLAHAYGTGVGGSWTVRAGYTPVLDIDIAGADQGNCYAEASYGAGEVGELNSTTKMVRERFTTPRAMTVLGAGIRLLKVTGSTDALTVSLRSAADAELASFTIPAASIATGPAFDAGGTSAVKLGYAGRWVEGTFAAPVALDSATEYRLRFSTGASSTCWAWVNRKIHYGLSNYTAATCFHEGIAEKTTNGTDWSALGSATNEHDLQSFLRTTA